MSFLLHNNNDVHHRTTSFFISSEKWNLIFKFRVILSYDSEIKQKKCPGLNCTYCLFLLHNNNDVHPTTTSSFFIPSENEIWSVWCSGWAKLVWWPHNGTPRSFQVEFSSNYYSCSGRSLDWVRPSKTQNLFTLYENIILQKFTDTIIQVLKFFFSLWHHGGCQRPFLFLWYECYLTNYYSCSDRS